MQPTIKHNFILGPVDTDSISFCKPGFEPFTKEEQDALLDEINSYNPELIKYSHDGYFSKILVVKAKNYVLVDEKGKVKIKGSALRAPAKEVALKEFIDHSITNMLNEDLIPMLEEYNKLAMEIYDLKNIKRWLTRKTVSDAVQNPERLTEQKIADAIEGENLTLGDKAYVFFKDDDSLGLEKDFNGSNYSKKRLLKKLYNTLEIFEQVIELDCFIDFSLVRSENVLREMIGLAPLIKVKKPRKKKEDVQRVQQA